MDSNKECKVQSCIRQFILPAIAVYVFMLLTGFLIHHVWLMPLYKETQSLWRDPEEIQALAPLMFIFQAALALIITKLYRKRSKNWFAEGVITEPDSNAKRPCPLKRGVIFGMLVGLLMGVMSASSFVWMPIPSALALDWLIGYTLQGIGIGIILSLACKSAPCAKP